MTYVTARTEGGADAPLFFTFHGTGGDESQFHGLASQLIPGARVISPRGNVMEGSLARYFKRTGEGIYDMDDLGLRTKEMASFLATEKAATDPDRTIALGYSNGANILAAVMFQTPDVVDDLILMHPLIPWTPDPQPGLTDRRILMTAGKRDPICPASQTQALADYLTAQGAKVTLDWHEGGHEIAQSELTAVQSFLS
ncbi:MAG: alpha/beta hydrolase [Silicimonas sp.]|nr:alpha/beta hydrolase [Silicimonas sp.]